MTRKEYISETHVDGLMALLAIALLVPAVVGFYYFNSLIIKSILGICGFDDIILLWLSIKDHLCK